MCLALGSSLTVTPAAGIPEDVADHGGALVIVNMQDTPLDGKAAVRVHAPVDEVMEEVMRLLGVVIAPWDEGAYWASHAEGEPATVPATSRVAGVTGATASRRDAPRPVAAVPVDPRHVPPPSRTPRAATPEATHDPGHSVAQGRVASTPNATPREMPSAAFRAGISTVRSLTAAYHASLSLR